LYERPRTSFVASFVGTSNLISGPAAVALTGSPQTFSVRPEKIRLVEPGVIAVNGQCTADGTILDAVYVGMHTRYRVQLDAGGELIVVEQNLDVSSQDVSAARGRRVRLLWPQAANHILESGESPASDGGFATHQAQPAG
jgi:putative spermidine/putrescine transport system ATP-binding protein